MTTLIVLIGVCAGLLVAVLLLEIFPPELRGKAARSIQESFQQAEERPNGVRGAAAAIEKPVSKWTPAWLLQRMRRDLYWAQLGGAWRDWTPGQVLSLRILAAGALGILGLIVFGDFLLGALTAFLGWEAPGMLVSRAGRGHKRRFQEEFPEYVQLLAAQSASGISLEEALSRTSGSVGAVPSWIARVVRASQGRSLFDQLEKEARETGLPELVSFAIQLEYVTHGVSQQDLLGKLARSIASEYLGQAESRAERVGAELVVPMVVFYFLPFVLTILAIIGWPILESLGGS
ncbi:MAG: type II secretion system F family protein [Anaerolineales bacterium]|jgi:tight adherence protein C